MQDNEREGIIADSAFYDIPDFDPVWDCAVEEFHNLKEGLTKQKMTRMFVKHKTKYSREILHKFSYYYESMAVFSETARRTRPIYVGQFKGHEFGVLALSAMPLLCLYLIRSSKKQW